METGTRRKLGEKGRDEVAPALLVCVPKVKIEIPYQGLTRLANGLDVLDDSRTDRRYQRPLIEIIKRFTNQRTVLPEPATKYETPSNGVITTGRIDTHVFHESRVTNPSTSSR
jgi:hypothetical protein